MPVEYGRESCLGAHSNVVSTEGLVEAGNHEFIVPQICEVGPFSPIVFSCLGAGMEKADSWTDSCLGCCQAHSTILGTEAIGKRMVK